MKLVFSMMECFGYGGTKMEIEELKINIIDWAEDEAHDSNGANISCAKILTWRDLIKRAHDRQALEDLMTVLGVSHVIEMLEG